MSRLIAFLIIQCLTPTAYAGFFFDSCATLERQELPTESTVLRLIRQHRVVEHESMNKLGTLERHNYLVEFFRQLCLMPNDHRSTIANRRIEIHLMAGTIAQHQWIKTLTEGPRGHEVSWAELPGVAGVSKEAPSIIDVTSLNKGHGSANLVLHEQAHVLDRFLRDRKSEDFDISPTTEFQEVYKDTPWTQVYPLSLISYHRDYPEEHFAELYAKWYSSEESKAEIRALIPGAEDFFNSLLPIR